MVKRSEVLDFIADCLSAGRCNVVSDKKQDEWIGKLSELPPESFPAILEQLKKLKRKPKNFPLTCIRIYKEFPVIDLKENNDPEEFTYIIDPNPPPTNYIHEVGIKRQSGWRATYDDIRGIVARLLVRIGL